MIAETIRWFVCTHVNPPSLTIETDIFPVRRALRSSARRGPRRWPSREKSFPGYKSSDATLRRWPSPWKEPTSSAATSAFQQTCSEIRIPVIIMGNAPGIITAFSKTHLDAPCTFAASIRVGSTFLIPALLLITEGTKAESQTTKILASSPRPNQRMLNGIQASGGMGRSNEKTGPTNASTSLLAPINRPSGTPSRNGCCKSTRYDPAALNDMIKECSSRVTVSGNDLIPSCSYIRRRWKASGSDKIGGRRCEIPRGEDSRDDDDLDW